MKCLLPDSKVSDHDFVCYGYQFLPFQRFWYFILELFWQCGILLFLFYYSLLNIRNRKKTCMTKETVISFAMLVKASKLLIIKVDLSFASTWVHPQFSCVDLVFFCCCPIMCLYVLSSAFRIQTMFGSSLPLVVCGMAHVLFTLFVFLFCLSPSCVLCTQCCQFLWIVHVWLPLRYFLTFI